MKILVCTGIYPPDVGGPAEYARHLFYEFCRQGNRVKVLVYKLERKLPFLVSHSWYFFRVLFNIYKANLIIALDTFSVGWPAVCAARLFRKKILIRIGGDFLWENYVEATGHLITLSDFYKKMPALSLRHKTIFSITKFVLRNASALVFTTGWQKDIWQKAYNLKQDKLFIVENYYGEKTSLGR
jgi:hypothetical protein